MLRRLRRSAQRMPGRGMRGGGGGGAQRGLSLSSSPISITGEGEREERKEKERKGREDIWFPPSFCCLFALVCVLRLKSSLNKKEEKKTGNATSSFLFCQHARMAWVFLSFPLFSQALSFFLTLKNVAPKRPFAQ